MKTSKDDLKKYLAIINYHISQNEIDIENFQKQAHLESSLVKLKIKISDQEVENSAFCVLLNY